MEQRDRRGLWQGFGEGLTQGFELALTPVVFALLGLYLDGRFDTRPALTIGLAVFATAGVFLRAWYHYVARVEAFERGKAWRRHR